MTLCQKTKSEDKNNRDILIGLDISTSQCEVNLELVKIFKKVLKRRQSYEKQKIT